jgi:hypothetical protein
VKEKAYVSINYSTVRRGSEPEKEKEARAGHLIQMSTERRELCTVTKEPQHGRLLRGEA